MTTEKQSFYFISKPINALNQWKRNILNLSRHKMKKAAKF